MMALLALLVACRVYGGEPSDAAVPGGIGWVYVCGGLEVCWAGGVAELEQSIGAECKHTARHAGQCIYRCPGGIGCNAFAGCWCPP